MVRGPSPVLAGGLSLVVERGSPLAVVSPAAERWPLGTRASTAVAPGLRSCGTQAQSLSCGIFPARDGIHVPCIDR